VSFRGELLRKIKKLMKIKNNISEKTELVANWQTLMRVFIRPENEETKLILLKYMEQILFGLNNFLKKHVGITEEVSLKELSMGFTDTIINKNPEKKLAEVITELIEDIAPHAVNVAFGLVFTPVIRNQAK